MILVLEVAAFLAAAAVVSTLFARKANFSAITSTLAVLAVGLGYFTFGAHAWQTIQIFSDQHKAWSQLTPAQEELVGSPTSADSFVEWIRGRIRPHESFFIVPSPSVDEAVRQWYTYRLLPHLETDRPEDADLLIFYGTSPKLSRLSSLISGKVDRLDKTSLIARTKHAG